MLKLSFIGDLTVDVYPQKKQINLGGASLISALWAKKLSAKATIVAAVGSDEVGKKYKAFLKKKHLSDEFITILNTQTSQINIFLDKNGEHTFGEWKPGAYGEYHLGQKEYDFLKTQDAVVLPVYFKTKRLLDETIKFVKKKLSITPAEKPFLIVDFDDLSQFGKSTKIIEDYLQYIDIVKLGLDIDKDKVLIEKLKNLSKKKFPRNTPNVLNSRRILIVTLGSSGSLVYKNGKKYLCPAPKIKPKNTTNAGDAYLAGFIVEYLKTRNIKKALENGTETAVKQLATSTILL